MDKITINISDTGYSIETEITGQYRKDYHYKGKQNPTIDELSGKIHEILTQERNNMIQKILNGDK